MAKYWNRTPYVGAVQYWGVPNLYKDVPLTSDPLTLANFNKNTCGPPGTYKVSYGYKNWWNETEIINASSISSVSAGVYLAFGVGVGIGADYGLDGLGLGIGGGIDFHIVDYSMSSSVGYSTTWTWNIYYSTVATEYFSACTGTIPGAAGPTPVLHIYESSS